LSNKCKGYERNKKTEKEKGIRSKKKEKGEGHSPTGPHPGPKPGTSPSARTSQLAKQAQQCAAPLPFFFADDRDPPVSIIFSNGYSLTGNRRPGLLPSSIPFTPRHKQRIPVGINSPGCPLPLPFCISARAAARKAKSLAVVPHICRRLRTNSTSSVSPVLPLPS
jgi:hypothetical protein